MSCFHFHLRANGRIHRDLDGSDCADVTAAHAHAVAVASELTRNSDRARLWSLCVADAHDEALFDLFFADVAARRGDLPRGVEELTAKTCRRITALIDAVSAARGTVIETRILIARARGKPQLVCANPPGRAPV